MNITIIGTGYVGLVSGICFSELGHHVQCFDIDKNKIQSLKDGILPIYEPGLAKLLKKNTESGRLFFTDNLKDALELSQVIFIAVGTPARRGDIEADNTFVERAARDVATNLNSYAVIVIKSTVPIGTNRKIKKIFNEINKDLDFSIVSNPEFLREGAAIEDFMSPDRVIIGFDDDRSKPIMQNVYKPLTDLGYPLIFSNLETAELTKYASNAFLATKISFINEIAALCEKSGANITDVAHGMGMDKRIGDKFTAAGPGYGGSCFPKDTNALVAMGQKFKSPQMITKATIDVNESVKKRMITKILDLLDQNIKNKVIVVLGVTFKANTDDVRDSPSLMIIPALLKMGAVVHVIDPKGRLYGEKLLGAAVWHDDIYQACINANLISILTEWDEFKNLDLPKISKLMREPKMADLRNIYDQETVLKSGFDKYSGVGK